MPHVSLPPGLANRLTSAAEVGASSKSLLRQQLPALWTSLKQARADGTLRDALRPVIGSLLLFLLISSFCNSYISYRRQVADASVARLDTLFPTFHVLSYICGTTRWTLGGDWFWEAKFDGKYAKYGSDIVTITSFFSPTPEFSVANAAAIRKLNLDRQTFRKPTWMYWALAFFGPNLVITEGDDWKRHRKVVQSSFSENAYPLVWQRTKSIIADMTRHEGWDGLVSGQAFVVDHIYNLTMRVALVVISEAGFGIRLPWADHQSNLASQAPADLLGPRSKSRATLGARPSTPDVEGQTSEIANPGIEGRAQDTMLEQQSSIGGRLRRWLRAMVGQPLSVQEALRIVAQNTLTRMLLPRWAFWLPSMTLWTIDRGFTALERRMEELVLVRRERILRGNDFDDDATNTYGSPPQEKRDLFGSLVRSSLEGLAQDGKSQISDLELSSNVFIFLLAGHETTASSLALTLANLALHPEVQQRLYKEVIAVAGEDGELSYADFSKLRYTLACYNESIRLFPPVPMLPKVATGPTTLRATLIGGGEEDVFIPRGSIVMIDVVGLHYNPSEWADPKSYRPERFLEPYNKDAFVPFSAGPRACIGRRFTEVESVCALVQLVRRFRIKPVFDTGETLRDVQERILQARQVITLMPLHCPLAFEAR